MNKTDLITAVSEKAGINKAVSKKALEVLIDVIAEQLMEGDTVQISTFGTFEISERAAREAFNPKNGEPISVKASKSPRFKASRTFKARFNP